MKTKDGLEIELIECAEHHDCGWGDWICTVTLPDWTVLDQCEVFSDGDEIDRSTLRDMSGPTARDL